tara:strand:+ start:50 stop:349 length:300 start_codon:yes stop_codon:yes gene_type:complete
MNSVRSFKALSVVTNVEQGEMVKRLIKENDALRCQKECAEGNLKIHREAIYYVFERYEKLEELHDYIHGVDLPGSQELDEILVYLRQEYIEMGLVSLGK